MDRLPIDQWTVNRFGQARRRPSIPPERLLCTQLLQIFYSISQRAPAKGKPGRNRTRGRSPVLSQHPRLLACSRPGFTHSLAVQAMDDSFCGSFPWGNWPCERREPFHRFGHRIRGPSGRLGKHWATFVRILPTERLAWRGVVASMGLAASARSKPPPACDRHTAFI